MDQRESKRAKVQLEDESVETNETEKIRDGGERNDEGENSQKTVSDDLCHECGEGGYLLCCDGCPKAFHKECLDPPLKRMPNKNKQWFCIYC